MGSVIHNEYDVNINPWDIFVERAFQTEQVPYFISDKMALIVNSGNPKMDVTLFTR